MAAKQSAQSMFPNLFGAQPAAKQPARPMSPADMRLLQYTMRQASLRMSGPTAAQRPMARPTARPAAR